MNRSLTRCNALVKITAAFRTVPNVSCGYETPTFNFGALNWISMSGCHFAGMKSQLVRRSKTVGLKTSKLFAQITMILINLKISNPKPNYNLEDWRVISCLTCSSHLFPRQMNRFPSSCRHSLVDPIWPAQFGCSMSLSANASGFSVDTAAKRHDPG